MKNKTERGRRDFLKKVLVAGGGAAALGVGGLSTLTQLAHGDADGDERFYVFAYFSGGWDVLLGIDPRPPSIADNLGVTRIQPDYGEQAEVRFQEAPRFAPGTEILLGPAARPLERVADRLTVVRGMSMDTLTHEVGRRRFITGKPPSGLQARGSAGSAWLASQFTGSLIPNLSVRVESFNPELSSDVSALRVGGARDLVQMLGRDTPTLDPELDRVISEMAGDQASCARVQSSPMLRSAESARLRMRAVLDADIKALFEFGVDPSTIEDAALRAEMERLHTHFDLSDANGPQTQAAIAGQALAGGIARVVTIQAAGGLDTHFDDWEDEQALAQHDGFEALAALAEYLEATPCGTGGESMLDRTTIVAFSEFMRTPLRNARGGRDHWLTNSCAIIGGKLRHPGVVGASSDVGMAPQAVNLESGRVDAGGEVMYPEHVLRTLLMDAGMSDDRADLRVGPIARLLG